MNSPESRKDQPELYKDTEYCSISYNPEFKAVQTKWKGIYCEGDAFKSILNAIIDLLALKKVNVIIADARNMKVISENDRKWIIADWYPRAVGAGFRCQALIISKDSFNELSIKKIVEHYDSNKIVTQYFIKFEDAAQWVKKISV